MQYLRPSSLHEAIRQKSETGYTLLAGGTDVYPALENHIQCTGLIDISGLSDLSGPVISDGTWWTIPAMTTWTALANLPLPRQFDVLREAAVEIGGRQIQNKGTIGGNLCNASPAADGVTALMALDSRVTLVGREGFREMTLESFVLGNRHTSLKKDEILLSVGVPVAHRRHSSVFKKLGSRRYLVISLVMVGVFVEMNDTRQLSRVGVCVGSCGPRSVRLKAAEERLLGMHLDEAAAFSLKPHELASLSPISDVRATASFRLAMARVLVEEGIRDAVGSLIDE